MEQILQVTVGIFDGTAVTVLAEFRAFGAYPFGLRQMSAWPGLEPGENYGRHYLSGRPDRDYHGRTFVSRLALMALECRS
jgi:hypothetical protein